MSLTETRDDQVAYREDYWSRSIGLVQSSRAAPFVPNHDAHTSLDVIKWKRTTRDAVVLDCVLGGRT